MGILQSHCVAQGNPFFNLVPVVLCKISSVANEGRCGEVKKATKVLNHYALSKYTMQKRK